MERGRPKENNTREEEYVYNFGGDIWYYNDSKNPHGPYKVEIGQEPELVTLDRLYNKLENFKSPEYHENGRKKRITKDLKNKIQMAEVAYRKEYNRVFPGETGKPKW
jgi:hypothetical protein